MSYNTLSESLFDIYASHPRVAILMSGQGSNAEALLAHEPLRRLYDIALIATDNVDSNASHIANKNDLETTVLPADHFEDAAARGVYFSELGGLLKDKGIEAVFYAGFMKVASAKFCHAFPGVNIHPANLTISGLDGLPKYRGMKAMSAMRADLGYVQSTVHAVEEDVDTGASLSLTPRLTIDKDMSNEQAHEALKSLEHITYPHTLQLIAEGVLNAANAPMQVEAKL